MLSNFITCCNHVLLGILMMFSVISSVHFDKNCAGAPLFQKAHYKNPNHSFTKKNDIFLLSETALNDNDSKDNIVQYFKLRNIKAYYSQNIPNSSFSHQAHQYHTSLYDLYCNWQLDC